MRQYLPNVLLFVLLATGLVGGWWYIDKTYFPKQEIKPPPPPTPAKELVGAFAGAPLLGAPPVDGYKSLSPLPPPSRTTMFQTVTGGMYIAAELSRGMAAKHPVVKPTEPQELIALGDSSFYNQVLLNTRGGAVQQVILTRFDEANRLGLEVKQPDGQPQHLRLIPGVNRPRVSLTEIHKHPELGRDPDLAPGKVSTELAESLSEPSYVLLHYPAKDDPRLQPDSAGEMNANHPSPELGDRNWTVVERHQPTDGSEWRVVFETTLDAPYFLKLRKTYTLSPKDYHIGFKVDIEPLPGRARDASKFRYQIAGPRQVPIEGEWYSTAYRHVMAGWVTDRGAARRAIEDSYSIQFKHGGDQIPAGGNTFTYAAVASQYFASALAVDNTQDLAVRKSIWDYVRPTREPVPGSEQDVPYLKDVTFRAVSHELDLKAGEPGISHRYLIYDGPVKVRLLWQLKEEWKVSDELIYRYMDDLTLRTMTDYHSPNIFGRFANMIWMTDLVVTVTNTMHWLLGGFQWLTGSWGVSIILLTVLVRLILLLPSRKQQIVMARMQEKMAKMKPEMDRLQEKYKDNPQLLQQEKTKLMLSHGFNPLSTMGGCFMLIAQMPIFMGLYYCLQESVFFRLQSFMGWISNLSAPDMLLWWSEKVPYLTSPDSIGSSYYLGPFLNILPLVAISLMMLQQILTMPPPADEQQEMQQRMMKVMMVVMAVFFYRIPSGLCLYFICSTSWALAERKLIPKPKAVQAAAAASAAASTGAAPAAVARANGEPSSGGFMSRLRAKLDEMQQQADEQSRRQIRRDQPPRPGGPPPPGGGGGKKKRRK